MSPLGYEQQPTIVTLGDTARLKVYLYDDNDQTLGPDEVSSVQFTIQCPDGSRATYQGYINDDGSGEYHFNETYLDGHYTAVATFTLANGDTRSERASFQTLDPFSEPISQFLLATDTPQNEEEAVGQGVWNKLSDCFDSQESGGPWLRMMTMQVFNPNKMAQFINEGIIDINLRQPVTDYNLQDFAASSDFVNSPNPIFPLIVEATFLAVIRHLMRSYVEQPLPQGGQVTWEDRRDYQNRWKSIYDVEQEMYIRWITMFKRGLYNFSYMASLIYNKSRSVYGPMGQRRTWGFNVGGY